MPFSDNIIRRVPQPSMTVEEFLRKNPKNLSRGIGNGPRFMDRALDKKRLQKLGMALAGFIDYLQPGRVYVFGNTEARFFESQTEEKRKEILGRIDRENMTCILLTQGLEIPRELANYALQEGIPVLRTPLDSSTAMYVFTEFLEMWLSPLQSIHGVLMDVFGVGVLILGESGIGKSECALELILRGHRIVSDDVVDIRILGDNKLQGSAPPQIQDVLELRGIGIVNVRELIGISAIRRVKHINFIIELLRWEPGARYERLGLSIRKKKVFGVELPFMSIPVAPGRNIAALIEVASRVYLMREHGLHPMGNFLKFLENSGDLSPVEGEEL